MYIDRGKMYSTLFIVVVLASVVQGSSDLSLSPETDYVLPESALEGINDILIYEELTVISKFNGFNPAFDLIARVAAVLAYNLTDESNDAATKVDEALAQAKQAVNYSLDAIPIATGGSCDCIETVRAEAYQNLDAAYGAISEAFAYALSANYAEIEKFRLQWQCYTADYVASIYRCIRTSLNTDSEDVLNVTVAAENGSGLSLAHSVNAVVNSIKALAAAYATGSARASLIIEIEGWRLAALEALKADVENEFGLLKAIYINSYQEQCGLISALARNQYANTVADNRYVAGYKAVFAVIKTLARNLILGFSDAGTNDVLVEKAAIAITETEFNAGTRQILISVKSDSKSVEEKLFQLNRGTATGAYNVVEIAYEQSLCSSADENEIKTLIDNGFDQRIRYAESIFDLLRGEHTFSEAFDEELKTLLQAAIDQLRIRADSMYKAAIILANSSSSSCLTDVIDSINVLEFEVAATARNFNNMIAYAGIRVIQATNKQ